MFSVCSFYCLRGFREIIALSYRVFVCQVPAAGSGLPGFVFICMTCLHEVYGSCKTENGNRQYNGLPVQEMIAIYDHDFEELDKQDGNDDLGKVEFQLPYAVDPDPCG